jgi:hypothetical protein
MVSKNHIIGFLLVTFLIITGFLYSCSKQQGSFVDIKEFEDLRSDYEALLKDYEAQATYLEIMTAENEAIKQEKSQMEKEISALDENIKRLEQEIEIISSYAQSAEDGLEEITPQKLRSLLDSLNKLLGFAYIGSSTDEESAYTFTAFSIEYKGSYYIITAGHCVQDNYGKEGTFKFKANFSDEWIYPKLLGYNAEFWDLDDFAVFYGGGIKGGLPIGQGNTPGLYLLGSMDKALSVFRNLGDSSRRGESGSAVINEQMEVVGIYVVYGYVYTPIGLALDAIDNAVIN